MTISNMRIATDEDFISVGVQLAQSLSENKWQLGDLACLACDGSTDIYRQITTVSSLAARIGVSRRSLSRYKVVAGFFPPHVRDNFSDSLSFTHFVHAYQNCNFDLDTALRQLEIAAEHSYSCDRFLAYLLAEEKREIAPVSQNLAYDAILRQEAYEGLKRAKNSYIGYMKNYDTSKDWKAIEAEMDRMLDMVKTLIDN